ncbi:MAG TPA: hypothetical protein VD997_14185 [Phycisphaerales bacterium]|nr:hypothetical protein [Phycisphaerales bacterium]
MSADLFAKFLGVNEGSNDPGVLLGVGPAPVNEGVVVTALQNRLTQIAAHPEGLSPEADEVRLALHAAAARLLSPAVRRPASEAAAPVDAQPTPLEAALLLTLATMGGWNPRSRERIGVLAQTYGVPVEQVVALAEGLMGRPVQHPTAPVQPSKVDVTRAATADAWSAARSGAARFRPPPVGGVVVARPSRPDFDDDPPVVTRSDPGNRVVRNLVIFGAVALFGSAALIVLSVTMTGPGSDPAAATPEQIATTDTKSAPQELFPSRPREQKPKPAPPAAPPKRIGDWDDLLRAASASVNTLNTDTDQGLAALEKVYAEMSMRWVETSGDGMLAGVDRLVEFLYRANTKGDAAERAIVMMIAAGQSLQGPERLTPQAVLRSAWTSGVLARVSREKDLPAGVRNRVHDALIAMFPGASGPGETTFHSGCIAALSTASVRLTNQSAGGTDDETKAAQEAWKAWLTGLAAIAGAETPLYTRHALLALDTVLTRGPDPLKSRAAFQAIGVLTTAVQWRKDDESRLWLLRWFDDDAVTSGDLYAVTAALAGASGAEGVDGSMVVSGGAGAGDRTEMRDRYAAMWGLGAGETRDALVQRWIEAVNAQQGAEASNSSDPLVMGEELLQLARYNRAAMLLWAGEVDGVADLLEPIQRASESSQDLTVRTKAEALYPGQAVSVEWLREYLAAGQNIPLRRELLAKITGPFDPIVAEVLVEEACRGSPMQVRQDAKDKIMPFLNTPPMLNALLEFAPLMPITRENAALVEAATLTQLPGLRDPTWRVAVRRALVETLLHVLAGQSSLSRIDGLAEQIAELYTPPAKATEQSAPEGQQEPPPVRAAATQSIDVAAVQLRLSLQREAEMLVPTAREPYNLTQMEQRRRARAELANGRVQEFQAEQIAMCELMAYICVAEQPSRAAQAGTILSEMDQERRRCKTAFEQLAVTERARLRLWILRFSERKA